MNELPDMDLSSVPSDAEDRELDAALAESEGALTGSLAQLLSPPADLGSRTHTHVATNLMSRSLLGSCADLLTVGWRTAQVLFGPEATTDEQHHDGDGTEVTS